MKRGEKILVAIGAVWTIGIVLFVAIRVNDIGLQRLSILAVAIIAATLLGIWTVLGLVWVIVYGRRE